MTSLPERVTFKQASDFLGVPVRCLHGQYVRQGLLPWPDRVTLTWARVDVLALYNWFEAKRRGGVTAPPQHRTH